jgi:hypothetical protein
MFSFLAPTNGLKMNCHRYGVVNNTSVKYHVGNTWYIQKGGGTQSTLSLTQGCLASGLRNGEGVERGGVPSPSASGTRQGRGREGGWPLARRHSPRILGPVYDGVGSVSCSL